MDATTNSAEIIAKKPMSLNYTTFRDAYKDYNKKILLQSKTKEWKRENKRKWDHKQFCLQHQLYPNLIKHHFTSHEIDPDLLNICQCGIIKNKVRDQFKPILRLSLDQALTTCDWKTKPAHFTDLNIDINNGEYIHSVQVLKIKIGAVKRYTQPKTINQVIATASFYRTSVFWELGEHYVLEFKLKTRCCREKVKVISNQTAKDVAEWWYQCWGVSGIREEKDTYLDCKQFFAIHNNTFVHKTSLYHNLQRVSLTLYKEVQNEKEVTATINNIPMINPNKIKKCGNKKEINPNKQSEDNTSSQTSNTSNLSQGSSQAQPRSQTLSPIRWNANQSEVDEDKDQVILRLRNELKESWKRERGLKRKINTLQEQNRTLTTNLRKQSMDFLPLSGEMRFSQEQDTEPPFKKMRL